MISQNVYVKFDTFNTRDEVLDFVYDEKNIPANGVEAWLRNVVYYDICPMLDEYWFDDKQKSEHWQNELTGIFSK